MKNVFFCKSRTTSPWCFAIKIKGNQIRKFFNSEAKANRYAREFKRQREQNGLEAISFNPEERADYKLALAEAQKRGFKTVFECIMATENTLTCHQKTETSKPTQDALSEYIAEKEALKRSKSTIQDIRVRVGRFTKCFPNFGGISESKIEKWCIQGGSPRSCRNNFIVVQSFLRWAKRRNYHSLNLNFERSAFLPRELKKNKSIFTLAQVNAILDLLQDEPTFRRFIPFFALQLFCGIRRAEAERMTWDLIDIEKKHIRLPAEITKTGDEHIMRPPFLPETVFEWLKPFAPTVNTKSKILFPSEWIRGNIVERLGFPWENNGMRHTFATMHVSLHGDPAKTAVLLRHRNQQRLWQNYLAKLISEEDASAYFELKPKNKLLMALGKHT